MTSQEDVSTFLARVRRLIQSGQVILVTRPKNQAALLAMGLNKRAAINDLLRLTARAYCGGPQDDRDRPGQQCWVFGQEVAGVEVYIKLVVEELDQGRERLKVLSYHQAEWALRYPFRGPPLGGDCE